MAHVNTECEPEFAEIKKQINILKRKNPWVRYTMIAEFAGFPRDVTMIITDYLQIIKLRDWIQKKHLNQDSLGFNPNAVLAGYIPDFSKASGYISANPHATSYVKQHADTMLAHACKWENPEIVEWLFSIDIYPDNIGSFSHLGFCKSMAAINWLLNNLLKKDAIEYLSGNGMAIDVLRQNMDLIDDEKIWGNSAAVDILQEKIAAGAEINWGWLSLNSSTWAMDLLMVNPEKISWDMFSENPSIFESVYHPNIGGLMAILNGEST